MRACLFLLLSLASSVPASLPAAPASVPPIMREWAEAQRHIGDIQVNFQQVRTVPALKEPVRSQGHFWRFADGSFRWELGRPAATVLVHDSKVFRVREEPGAPWKVLDEKDGRYRMWAQFLSGRDASPEQLAENFNLSVTGNTSEAVTVALMPKPLVVRRYLKQVDLQIEPQSKRLLQLRIIQGDGSTVTMQFSPPKPVPAGAKDRLLAP